jgi:hypothetical protein
VIILERILTNALIPLVFSTHNGLNKELKATQHTNG